MQDEARALTAKIRRATDDLWNLIVKAYQTRAWSALGYPSWDLYVQKELGDLKIRLPKESRREIMCSLRDNGLSLRAIASATGYDKHTVSRDTRDIRPQPPELRKLAHAVNLQTARLVKLAASQHDAAAVDELIHARQQLDHAIALAHRGPVGLKLGQMPHLTDR